VIELVDDLEDSADEALVVDGDLNPNRSAQRVLGDARFVEQLIEALIHIRNQRPASESDQQSARALDQLTPRERQVLARLAEGLTTPQIAENLSITVNTTRNHIQRILQKLNVHTRLEAVIHAIKNDLVD